MNKIDKDKLAKIGIYTFIFGAMIGSDAAPKYFLFG